MTDKQIIINGCDVCECQYLDLNPLDTQESYCLCSKDASMCLENRECYYKQYLRLKNKYLKRGETNTELNLLNKQLTSENTALKAMICENFEITPDVLHANIKLYRKEQQVKTKQRILKHIQRSKQ